MSVDGAQNSAEFGWCLGLVGGEEGPQEPVVQFGVEDRDLEAVGGVARR
jgi:hypothetical protein